MTIPKVLCIVSLASLTFLPAGLLADPIPARFDGAWVVTGFRQAQEVASPPGLLDRLSEGLGQVITVRAGQIAMEGLGCADWSLDPNDALAMFEADPILADLRIGPNDGTDRAHDARAGAAYRLTCEGQYATTIYQAEPRTLVATLENESVYMLLERPLQPDELTRLQAHLISVKFLAPPASGGLDEATLRALREWYIYRRPDRDAAVPLRPAITRNLLDATGVWND